MPGKIIWLDNCPHYVCWKDVCFVVKIQYTENKKKKRLKGWEPEFNGTGSEAYTTSSPSPYLSLGPTHIYINNDYVTSVTNDTLMQIIMISVWQRRRGDKIDRLISLFRQHPLKSTFPAWFRYNGIFIFWFAWTIFLPLFTISEIAFTFPC